MIRLDDIKNMVLYGDVIEAENFLYQNKKILNTISLCIFRNCSYPYFHGSPVLNSLDERLLQKKYFIVVVSSVHDYFLIKNELKMKGKEEFRDFVWSKAIDKKMVVVNANCHGEALIKYLELSTKFREGYFVYPVPEIQDNIEGQLSKRLLLFTNVYIHQDIKLNNKISRDLSDEVIEKKLGLETTNITIPNLVGMGNWMYPQLGELDKYIRTKEKVEYIFYRDEILDEAEKKYKSQIDKYVRFWNNYSYDKDYLDEIWKQNEKKLKKREENWDIKIYNYIYSNFRRIPCFVDANHPSKYVMREIGRQVAKKLMLDDIDDEIFESDMGLPVPILPSIKRYFQLDFCVPNERRKYYLGKSVMGDELEEYIRAYIWWHFERQL